MTDSTITWIEEPSHQQLFPDESSSSSNDTIVENFQNDRKLPNAGLVKYPGDLQIHVESQFDPFIHIPRDPSDIAASTTSDPIHTDDLESTSTVLTTATEDPRIYREADSRNERDGSETTLVGDFNLADDVPKPTQNADFSDPDRKINNMEIEVRLSRIYKAGDADSEIVQGFQRNFQNGCPDAKLANIGSETLKADKQIPAYNSDKDDQVSSINNTDNNCKIEVNMLTCEPEPKDGSNSQNQQMQFEVDKPRNLDSDWAPSISAIVVSENRTSEDTDQKVKNWIQSSGVNKSCSNEQTNKNASKDGLTSYDVHDDGQRVEYCGPDDQSANNQEITVQNFNNTISNVEVDKAPESRDSGADDRKASNTKIDYTKLSNLGKNDAEKPADLIVNEVISEDVVKPKNLNYNDSAIAEKPQKRVNFSENLVRKYPESPLDLKKTFETEVKWPSKADDADVNKSTTSQVEWIDVVDDDAGEKTKQSKSEFDDLKTPKDVKTEVDNKTTYSDHKNESPISNNADTALLNPIASLKPTETSKATDDNQEAQNGTKPLIDTNASIAKVDAPFDTPSAAAGFHPQVNPDSGTALIETQNMSRSSEVSFEPNDSVDTTFLKEPSVVANPEVAQSADFQSDAKLIRPLSSNDHQNDAESNESTCECSEAKRAMDSPAESKVVEPPDITDAKPSKDDLSVAQNQPIKTPNELDQLTKSKTDIEASKSTKELLEAVADTTQKEPSASDVLADLKRSDVFEASKLPETTQVPQQSDETVSNNEESAATPDSPYKQTSNAMFELSETIQQTKSNGLNEESSTEQVCAKLTESVDKSATNWQEPNPDLQQSFEKIEPDKQVAGLAETVCSAKQVDSNVVDQTPDKKEALKIDKSPDHTTLKNDCPKELEVLNTPRETLDNDHQHESIASWLIDKPKKDETQWTTQDSNADQFSVSDAKSDDSKKEHDAEIDSSKTETIKALDDTESQLVSKSADGKLDTAEVTYEPSTSEVQDANNKQSEVVNDNQQRSSSACETENSDARDVNAELDAYQQKLIHNTREALALVDKLCQNTLDQQERRRRHLSGGPLLSLPGNTEVANQQLHRQSVSRPPIVEFDDLEVEVYRVNPELMNEPKSCVLLPGAQLLILDAKLGLTLMNLQTKETKRCATNDEWRDVECACYMRKHNQILVVYEQKIGDQFHKYLARFDSNLQMQSKCEAPKYLQEMIVSSCRVCFVDESDCIYLAVNTPNNCFIYELNADCRWTEVHVMRGKQVADIAKLASVGPVTELLVVESTKRHIVLLAIYNSALAERAIIAFCAEPAALCVDEHENLIVFDRATNLVGVHSRLNFERIRDLVVVGRANCSLSASDGYLALLNQLRKELRICKY